jgi:hypothetical protein
MEPRMPRPRQRVCLQDGLKLDLNRLARRGFVQRGANLGPRGITWTHSYWGAIASGIISADMSGQNVGWLRIQLDNFNQTIVLIARPRHFGGRQWYFMCPTMNRPVSVLWKPNGALDFRCRRAWEIASLINRNSTTPQIDRQIENRENEGRSANDISRPLSADPPRWRPATPEFRPVS